MDANNNISSGCSDLDPSLEAIPDYHFYMFFFLMHRILGTHFVGDCFVVGFVEAFVNRLLFGYWQ